MILHKIFTNIKGIPEELKFLPIFNKKTHSTIKHITPLLEK